MSRMDKKISILKYNYRYSKSAVIRDKPIKQYL